MKKKDGSKSDRVNTIIVTWNEAEGELLLCVCLLATSLTRRAYDAVARKVPAILSQPCDLGKPWLVKTALNVGRMREVDTVLPAMHSAFAAAKELADDAGIPCSNIYCLPPEELERKAIELGLPNVFAVNQEDLLRPELN